MKLTNPQLYNEYELAKAAADRTLDHVRNGDEYPLTGHGDINTYVIFAELARKIVRSTGRVGLLVPSGIATEDTTKVFFNALTGDQSLIALYDFENKNGIFQDVHRSFKFSVLLFGGSERKTAQADFMFFAHDMKELSQKNRHVPLSAKDLALLNPNMRTCPIFKTRRDAELTKSIYRRVPILVDKARKSGGNPWRARLVTIFHQTNDAEAFLSPTDLFSLGAKQVGNRWSKGQSQYLPLYEAKMFRPYDHRFGSIFIRKENWINQGQTDEMTLVQHQNPEFVAQPRWWVASDAVLARLGSIVPPAMLAFRDVTRSTDDRTMLATFLPLAAATNTAPLILFDPEIGARRQCCLLANLNSIPLDFVAKRKVPHIHMNFFIAEQLPILPPDTYDDRCPWDKKQTLEKWISDRVLKLTCTADDMRPLAEAAGFKEGVHKWKEPERAELRAELDAAYFHLYGINREDAEYILSTFQGMTDGDEGSFTPTSAASRILEAYDALAEVS